MLNLKTRLSSGALVGFLLLMLSSGLVSAASPSISYPYQSSTSLSDGELVSQDASQNGYVTPANLDNSSKLLGIVVSGPNSLIAVGQTPGRVQVAAGGTTNALMSTINGDIAPGIQLSVSPLNGIGMKALAGSRIVGVARSSLSSKTPGAETETIKNKNGQPETVKIGYVEVSIAVGAYVQDSTSPKLTTLQRVVRNITGKTIPTTRIIVSMIIALVTIVALFTVIYTSISSTIISVARNPLAKHAIFHTLTSVMLMVLLATSVSGLVIYFLLD
jgi:hypothetical protein